MNLESAMYFQIFWYSVATECLKCESKYSSQFIEQTKDLHVHVVIESLHRRLKNLKHVPKHVHVD